MKEMTGENDTQDYLDRVSGGFLFLGALLAILSGYVYRSILYGFRVLLQALVASGVAVIEHIGWHFGVIGSLFRGIAGAVALWFAYGRFTQYGFWIISDNGVVYIVFASLAVVHGRP